jgi:hypothetical protein
MLPTQSINTMLQWEKRLEIEEQKRSEHRSEITIPNQVQPQPVNNGDHSHKSLVIKRDDNLKIVHAGKRQEICCETQPG